MRKGIEQTAHASDCEAKLKDQDPLRNSPYKQNPRPDPALSGAPGEQPIAAKCHAPTPAQATTRTPEGNKHITAQDSAVAGSAAPPGGPPKSVREISQVFGARVAPRADWPPAPARAGEIAGPSRGVVTHKGGHSVGGRAPPEGDPVERALAQLRDYLGSPDFEGDRQALGRMQSPEPQALEDLLRLQVRRGSNRGSNRGSDRSKRGS
eukprot:1189616-Prorocentrum_minimum.AAC.4